MAARTVHGFEPLVGRTDELASLQQALDELDRGGPGAVALLGEPGIGKTRLLRELGVRAEQRWYLVLSGSASVLERDLPFSAFVDALDEYVESLDQTGSRPSTTACKQSSRMSSCRCLRSPCSEHYCVARQSQRC